MNILLFLQLSPRMCIALVLTTTTACANQIERLPQSASACPSTYPFHYADSVHGFSLCLSTKLKKGDTTDYLPECRTSEFAFRYSADFRLSVADHGMLIRLLPRSQSAYWEDAIIIHKHNRKTEECDLPQNSQPENRDRRNIAGQRAYAYSGEDAAMNRYIRTKGYMIERGDYCWDFQIIRKGKPYRKFDLPEKELKRLDDLAARDAKTTQTAFNTVLDSFSFVRPK